MPTYSIENPQHSPSVMELANLDKPIEMICGVVRSERAIPNR